MRMFSPLSAASFALRCCRRDDRYAIARDEFTVLLIPPSVIIFLVGLPFEQISSLRFERHQS
jgi:hypothetical protein